MDRRHEEEWGKPTQEDFDRDAWGEGDYDDDYEPTFKSYARLKHAGLSDFRIKHHYDDLVEDLAEDGKKLIYDACGSNPTPREMRIVLAMSQILTPIPPLAEPFASMTVADCAEYLINKQRQDNQLLAEIYRR